jgi:hypothetical protein
VITPVALTRRWTATGSVRGRGGGPARRAPWSRRAWSGVSGSGPDAQQLARLRVEEHQRVRFDADDHGAGAEDLGGEHLPAAQADE